MNTAAALVRAKREGCRLDAHALAGIAQGIASGAWCDAQVGAFAMAVAWRGMTEDECRDFALALRDSGHTLRWDLDGPVLDKHSTGGVGDGVSLVLAPLVAACGGCVPMISGRGLGHTGGTLDKLESLPGYTVACDEPQLLRAIAAAGCAIVGQSDALVPADRRLYAIRDVTATVDVPDLIVASILSKKLAAGADALVLDLKVGSGAQSRDDEAARALAARMLAVARGSGLPLAIAFSDMDQVLGRCVGNALELRAAVELLAGSRGDARLRALTIELAAELLVVADLAPDLASACARLEHALASGVAADRFERMVVALGGPGGCVARPDRWFPVAPVHHPVEAARAGTVQVCDVRAIGEAVVALGGGRRRPDDRIDPAVGLSGVVADGERVERGEPLAIVHARTLDEALAAERALRGAIRVCDEAPPPRPLFTWHARFERRTRAPAPVPDPPCLASAAPAA